MAVFDGLGHGDGIGKRQPRTGQEIWLPLGTNHPSTYLVIITTSALVFLTFRNYVTTWRTVSWGIQAHYAGQREGGGFWVTVE